MSLFLRLDDPPWVTFVLFFPFAERCRPVLVRVALPEARPPEVMAAAEAAAVATGDAATATGTAAEAPPRRRRPHPSQRPRKPSPIRRSQRRWARPPNGSRRSWPKSHWIHRQTAVPVPRGTTCTSGSPPSWGRPGPSTRAACSSWTFTSHPSIRSNPPRYRTIPIWELPHHFLTPSIVFAGHIQNADISLQYQQPGRDLPGHPQGQLVAGADHLEGAALHLFASNRLQSR